MAEADIDSRITGDLIKLGQRIQQTRKLKNMTLDEVAAKANVTKSLLSKIENYRAVPSLPVLIRIAATLDVDPSDLIRGFGRQGELDYVVIRKGESEAVERDESYRFFYEAIISRPIGNVFFDSQVLTIYPDSQRRQVSTDGMEFLFILKGQLDYHLSDQVVELKEGDALLFDGRIPHVPVCTDEEEAKILAIYLLQSPLQED